MEFRFQLLALMVIVGVASCREEDKKPCLESKYEIDVGGSIAQVMNGTGVGIFFEMQTAADHDGHMYGSEAGYYVLSGYYVQIKNIQNWNTMKSYTITNGICTVTPLVGPEPSPCVPDDAKFQGYTVLGKKEFVTQSWELPPQDVGLARGGAHLSLSNETCIPTGISFIGISDTPGMEEMPISYSAGYYNYVSGISDPKRWFDIPPSCNPKVMATNNKFLRMIGLDIINPVSKLFQNIVFRGF